MRASTRVSVEKLASEVVGNKEELGLVVDLSAGGLRLERNSLARRASPIVQLEFAIPEVNEIVWAKGEVCFDQLSPNLIRSTGIRIIAAANRHMRMLRDYVMSAIEARDEQALMYASHWRG